MKKAARIFFLVISSASVFGQTIQELERDLLIHRSSEKYEDKIFIARKLFEFDPFNRIAARYICDYYQSKKIDSVSIFFDNLRARFPTSPKPYLLRYELLFVEHDYHERDNYNIQKIKLLNAALKVDGSNQETLYNLAKTYYEDFIYPYEKQKHSIFETVDDSSRKEQSTFKYSADSALHYFYRVWNASKNQREIIYFPIRQLECHLNQLGKSQIPKQAEREFQQCFFPSSYFANLKGDWQCDKTLNYLFEIEMSKGMAERLRNQLLNLKENCLYNTSIALSADIYRFTWLRSFHHPISIRMEKSQGNIMLYWKMGKGAGGYEPKGVKKSGKAKLKPTDWIEFTNLLGKANFDNLPNEEYMSMNDGATWTLERRSSHDYKAHNTNEPSKEFKGACLYLLERTRIKVKPGDIY